MKMTPSIHIGTSGWSYKHWRKIFYPEKLKSRDWLTYYQTVFSTTELNNSFYKVPSPAAVELWKTTTGNNFIFCPKMSRYLSHVKKLNDPIKSSIKFFEALEPLKRKLGPILIQLPAMLAFHKDKTEILYKAFKKHYGYYRFAIEVRHVSWMEEESIALMRKYNIAFVISQSAAGFPYAELVTANHIYVRFHGPAAMYASGYSKQQLLYSAKLFKQWKKAGHTVWAFFNNDIDGYAFENAKLLKQLCDC